MGTVDDGVGRSLRITARYDSAIEGVRSRKGALLCILMSMHASLHLPFKLPMTFSVDRQSRCWFANIGDTDRNKGNAC
jgi:hypothetical protein